MAKESLNRQASQKADAPGTKSMFLAPGMVRALFFHGALLPALNAKPMSVGHYENFPVASVLLPRRLRAAIAVIYCFARSADDIADEGDASDEERLAGLAAYRAQLIRISSGRSPAALPAPEMFAALAEVIRAHRLPVQLFEDLLDAFSQDVAQKRYADFAQVRDYCRRSANPVGRLILHLYGAVSDAALVQSDAICTSLQLINFCQDVGVDFAKHRIYLPKDSLTRFGVAESDFAAGRADAGFRALMTFEVARARQLMYAGAPLVKVLRGRAGWELRLVVQGGLRILEKIEKVGYDIFNQRPVLGACDWPLMAWRALRM